MMEIRRKINKQNLKFDHNKEHLKDLHNLDKTRRQAKEELYNQKKIDEEKALDNFTY